MITSITNEAYHAQEALSASGAKRILRSVAHYLVPTETTPAMMLGTAIHTAVLEPDEFVKTYCVKPDDVDFRTKEGKDWKADNYFKTILTASQMATCQGIAASCQSNKITAKLLESGKPELSYHVRDPEYDVDLRIRPDFLSDRGFILDLKSTQDARADAFSRAIVTYQYDLQAAFYKRVHKIETGDDIDFLFIAAEKDAPYAVATYMLDESFIDRGTKAMHEALKIYADWIHSDKLTPSPYPEIIAELSPPGWAMKGVYE
jgi:exodeoxyribonuclease VIII